jgi:hypothetical protein
VQELMGHATIAMTERYAHLAPRVARETVLLLDDAVPNEANSAKNLPNSPSEFANAA